jgi:predicted nucleic acid-binding protein
MVLVDSSAWIESFRKKGRIEVKRALEGLLEAFEAQWCSPVRLEVLGRSKINERKHLSFYFSVIPYRPCRESDWENARVLAWRLRENRYSLPWMDILIAAIAIEDDVRLYTIKKHFEIIAQHSNLFLYQPSYGGMYNNDNPT